MSTTIDSKVVEMQFDNKQFEANVSTSMSTLEKLKQSLNLTGATKGLENLDSAAKKVNMSGLNSAVETVHAKFSALEVMGVTALANITNSAVNAGKRVLKAFTVDPVKTGFSEYELKMGSVQTIMASTGASIDTVNKYLNELNEYSDKTIYSFSDMTNNIGKFTNAGVKLEDAVLAIKGISNEAAVSGANANEASRAMYNFAQALSAGYVKLIDWKSIENANMATVEFKNQLIESAVAAGTLTKTTDGMYKTLDGTVISATQNFNDSLQDQWMTTEVLVGTLRKYADENTEIGKKAFAAAQDVKTFSMMMDTLKETAQSGWAQTWELIFGDLETAKKLWTSLTNFFSNIINKSSEFRNNLLEGALGSPFGKLVKKIENVKSATDKSAKAMKDYNDIVNKVIRGDFGNMQTRWDALTESGYDWAHVQNLVNERLGSSVRYTTKYTEAQNKANKTQNKTNKSQKINYDNLAKMSDVQLKNIGYTESQIKAIRELSEEADKLGLSLSEFIEKADGLDGRTLLLNSFKNIADGLVGTITALKDAWSDVFPPMTSKQLYDIIAGFHKLSTNLTMSDDTADKLKRTFKGVFAMLDVVLTLVGGPLKIVFKAITQLLGMFDMDILSVTASIGDAIVGFRDWIDSALDFTKIFEKILPSIKKFPETIHNWISGLKDASPRELAEGIVNGITNGFSKALELIKGVFTSLRDFIAEKTGVIPEDLISGLVNGIRSGAGVVGETLIELGKIIIEKIKGVLGIHSPSVEFFDIGKNIILGLVNGLRSGASTVWNFIKKIGTKCVELLSKIDFGALFAAGFSVGILVAIKDLTNVLDKFAAPLEGLGDMLTGIGDAFSGLGAKLKAAAWEKKSKAVLNIAIAIGILAASIYLLTQIDTAKMWGAIGALAVLAGIILALSFAINKVGETDFEVGKLGLTLVGISVSLLILASALKKLSFLNEDNVGIILGALAAMVVGLTAILAVYGTLVKGKAAQNIDKAGIMLMKMAGAMLILAVIAKILAGMTWDDMKRAAVGLGGLVAVVLLLTAITQLAGKRIDKVGLTLYKIAGAMLILTIVAKVLVGMTWDDMKRAAVGLLGLSVVVFLLVQIATTAGKDIDKVGPTLLKIAGAMFILTFTAKIIAGMSWGEMGKAAIGLLGLSVIIGILVKITQTAGKDTGKIATTLLALSVAIGVLALVAVLLGLVSIEHLAKGIIAVGMLGGIMTLMIWATKGANDCKGNIIAMTAAIAVMAIAVATLSLIDGSKLAGATIALSTVMGMFALIAKASGSAQKAMGSLIVMTITVGLLAGVLYLLSQLPTESVLGSAIALSTLMLAMSVVMAILSLIGTSVSNALLGAVGLLAMSVPLLAFVGILALMQNVQNAMTNVVALTTLATAMTVLLIPLSVIGALVAATGGIILLGIVALLAMAVPLLAFVGILALMQNVQNATTNVMLLTTFMNTMTNMLVKIALVAPLAILGVAAIAALTGVMIAIGALAVGIGALMTKFPALEEFVDVGMPILGKIANGIGSIIGNLINGFATAATAGLPELGATLSAFMVNAMPFIAGAKMIDDGVFKGIKNLTKAVIALTVADLIEGMNSFLSGGSSFAELGTELSNFMINAMPFVMMSGMLNASAMKGVKALAEAILILTKADLIDGLLKWPFGESTLEKFGKEIAAFGPSLAAFGTSVAGVDPKAIESAAKAAKLLAEMAASLPNSGGLLGKITGENDMSTFSADLVAFGQALKSYTTTVSGIDEGGVESVNISVKIAKKLVELAESIPNEGGLLAVFTGDNNIATFGANLKLFGQALKSYVTTVSGIDEGGVEAVDTSVKIAKKLINLAEAIPDSGGLFGMFSGDNNIADFGMDLLLFGQTLKSYATTVSGIEEDSVEAVKSSVRMGKSLTGLAEAVPKMGGIFSSENDLGDLGSKLLKFGKKLKAYADEVSGMESETVNQSVTIARKLIKLINDMSGLDASGVESFKDAINSLAKTNVSKFAE